MEILFVLKSVVNENIHLSINKIESQNNLFLTLKDSRGLSRYKKEVILMNL